MDERKCLCGAPVTHSRKSAVWCSDECRKKWGYGPRSAITIIECYVCGDLFVVRGGVKKSLRVPTACHKVDCQRQWNTDRTREARHSGRRNTVTRRLIDRVCGQCGASFQGRRDEDYEVRFCSETCRDEHWAAKAVRDKNGRKLSYKERKALASGAPVDREAIFDRDGWICHICGGSIDPTLKFPNRMSASTDHVIPLAGLLGTNEPSNIKAAHWICNMRKTDKLQGVNGEYSETNRASPGREAP